MGKRSKISDRATTQKARTNAHVLWLAPSGSTLALARHSDRRRVGQLATQPATHERGPVGKPGERNRMAMWPQSNAGAPSPVATRPPTRAERPFRAISTAPQNREMPASLLDPASPQIRRVSLSLLKTQWPTWTLLQPRDPLRARHLYKWKHAPL